MKPSRGFTLIEVLVALGIVAIALAAGLRATSALTNNALRQSSVLLAHICAENELVKVRLARQMPGVGETSANCEQAGRTFDVRMSVLPTPNPSFHRVDAQVIYDAAPVLRLSSAVGRYCGAAALQAGASRWWNCWSRCSRSRCWPS
jgi:general secretion pathway protein I